MTPQEKLQIIEELKAQNPEAQLFEIEIPGREDELYVCKMLKWFFWKQLVGKTTDQAIIVENVVTASLLYPKLGVEEMMKNIDGGVMMTLSEKIQEANGYNQGSKIKNL